MKLRYLLVAVLSVVVAQQAVAVQQRSLMGSGYAASGRPVVSENKKIVDEKSIRSELHMLLEKKDVNRLTLAEVRRVRHLMHELKKINKKAAEHLSDRYIRPEDQCSFELSDFENREIEVELNDLFGNPKPKNSKWEHDVRKFLNQYDKQGCREDDLDYNDEGYPLPCVSERYKAGVKRYKQITGHEYKP